MSHFPALWTFIPLFPLRPLFSSFVDNAVFPSVCVCKKEGLGEREKEQVREREREMEGVREGERERERREVGGGW